MLISFIHSSEETAGYMDIIFNKEVKPFKYKLSIHPEIRECKSNIYLANCNHATVFMKLYLNLLRSFFIIHTISIALRFYRENTYAYFRVISLKFFGCNLHEKYSKSYLFKQFSGKFQLKILRSPQYK